MSRTERARGGAGLDVLVVEDNDEVASLVADTLRSEDYNVSRAETLAAAREALSTQTPEIVLLDMNLPDGYGLDLLREISNGGEPSPAVLALTADASIDTVVNAVRLGAYDYVTKPFDPEELLIRVGHGAEFVRARDRRQLLGRQRRQRTKDGKWGLPSPKMKAVMASIERIARFDEVTTLICGETGSGKEIVAQTIHDLSDRADQDFVAVNCATFDQALLKSELFGHEKGAFTGASERRRGLFELASGGTLFLDEVAEMPMDVQAAFLRVLETRRFYRVGGSVELTTTARIVTATNKDLRAEVQKGNFREDLLYRLNTVEIVVPPLRERREDIPVLAEMFCERFCRTSGIDGWLTQEALDTLCGYSWPGNIRELRNAVERAAVLAGGGAIDARFFLFESDRAFRQEAEDSAVAVSMKAPGEGGEFLTLEEMELQYVNRVLEKCGGNKSQAADVLGISRNTLLRKIRRSDL